MNKFLTTLIAFMLFVSSTTYAQDVQILFGTNEVKSITLSIDEMKNTEGTYGIWGALAGAGAGAAGYLIHTTLNAKPFSPLKFGVVVTAGAAAGAITPTPAAMLWAFRSPSGIFSIL